MAESKIKRTQDPNEITLYGNANIEFQYGGGSWVQRIIFDLNGTNKSMLEITMRDISYDVSDDGGVTWQTLWKTNTIKRFVKVDATVLEGSYFDVSNLIECTSNSFAFFQAFTDGSLPGEYSFYLQPAAGHCLVYVRNLDGSMVTTGTRILGNLFYESP